MLLSLRRELFILGIIFLVAIILRFYHLGDFPVGFHRDEAFLGFNAYSILKTGKDITGNFLPLHLQSFLYSPAGYSYTSIPFIALFDLSPFSVRFASAFFGSLSILVTFFLAKELFTKNKNKIFYGLLSSFFLAIAPWHINLSRTATENVLAVFFISLGVLLYLHWVKNKKLSLLVLSFICLAVTLLIYQAPRAFLPFFIPLLFFSFHKTINKKNKIILLGLYVFLILLPVFLILKSPDISLRIRTVSIFNTDQTKLVLEEQIRRDGVSYTPLLLVRIFHNKITSYTHVFIQNYFKHFSYDFLFTDEGFPARYKVPLVGLLYVFELPLLVIGLISLIKSGSRVGSFLIMWILIVPIGSALTFDDMPNLQRTLLVFPALSIISASGFIEFVNITKQFKIQSISLFIISCIMFAYILFYTHQYYIHQPEYRPWYRQDGYKELVQNINLLLSQYNKAIITNHESAPAIFFLFYSKYNPHTFQQESKNSSINDIDRVNFGKYEFSEEECPATIIKKGVEEIFTAKPNILYANGGECKDPDLLQTLRVIKRGDNSTVFRIVKVKENYEK